jgi:hypothetical protein
LKFRNVILGYERVDALDTISMSPSEERVGSHTTGDKEFRDSNDHADVTCPAREEKRLGSTAWNKQMSGFPSNRVTWAQVAARSAR